jgi:hypothetical protein
MKRDTDNSEARLHATRDSLANRDIRLEFCRCFQNMCQRLLNPF